jgi:hypothetical protein
MQHGIKASSEQNWGPGKRSVLDGDGNAKGHGMPEKTNAGFFTTFRMTNFTFEVQYL